MGNGHLASGQNEGAARQTHRTVMERISNWTARALKTKVSAAKFFFSSGRIDDRESCSRVTASPKAHELVTGHVAKHGGVNPVGTPLHRVKITGMRSVLGETAGEGRMVSGRHSAVGCVGCGDTTLKQNAQSRPRTLVIEDEPRRQSGRQSLLLTSSMTTTPL